MKKQLLRTIIVLFSISLFFYSCSTDDSIKNQNEPKVDGELLIKKTGANTIILEYNGTSEPRLKYGIRKAGEQTFEEKTLSSSVETSINQLIPAQRYEVTLLLAGNPDFKSEIKTVTTQPFNTFEDQSTKVRRYIELSYSEIGFKHQLKTDVFNENANLTFFFVNKDNENDKIKTAHTYTDGILNFEAPKGWGSEPYEELRYYYLCYQIDGGEITKISAPETLEKNITFVVFNPTPQITEVKSIKKIDNCGGNTYYNLKFNGFFMNRLEFEFNSHRFFENSTAFITRDDDNTEYILTEESNGCRHYNRSVVKEHLGINPSDSNGMHRFHTSKYVSIQKLESTTPDFKFTTGDYKIRIVFSNDAGDFYETNTFPFTLP